MSLENELIQSEQFETDLFFTMSRKLYSECDDQSKDLFNIALKITDEFRKIDEAVILSDSRIIKVLRYCMLPVISQMKLGQLVDIATTDDFEKTKVTSGPKYKKLKQIAPKIAHLVNSYLDKQRFLWLNTELPQSQHELAVMYAKNWTCSLISNQNSSTLFRNWRKELQETTAVQQAVRAGYTSVEKRHAVSDVDDLLVGQYSRECRIKGRNVQKADIVVRLKKSKKLLLIEAKAIGVRIDAFKRIKECREKFDDWKESFGDNVCLGVVLSGFIPEKEAQSLLESGAYIFWEHNDDLYRFLIEN